jgi:hypothetical protein
MVNLQVIINIIIMGAKVIIYKDKDRDIQLLKWEVEA